MQLIKIKRMIFEILGKYKRSKDHFHTIERSSGNVFTEVDQWIDSVWIKNKKRKVGDVGGIW